MSDPTLVRASVTIRYTASDKFRAEVTYSNIGRMGVKPPAEAPLIEALEELTRLTALFGFEDHALAAFNDARRRVFEWRKTRDSESTTDCDIAAYADRIDRAATAGAKERG